MKKLVLPMFLFLLVSSCASIKVTTDFDKTAPFANYKTFAFTPEATSLNIDQLNRQRLISAIENELKLKGFSKSDNPDVLIDLKVSAKNIQTATASSTAMYGPGYRYRWGGGFSTTTINYDNYTEGTVFIDMIDTARKQLVWQGRGVGTVEPKLSPEKREKNINEGIKQIFAKYPPVK